MALDSVHRPTSIKDIARKANVSFSTVSRALQNSPLISRRTAEKIQRIARESGYRASAVARGLVTQRTKTIGVVVTTIADPFVSEVVHGIEECCNDHGYSVFLANSNADPDREVKVVHSFSERRVDGIVVTSSRVGALYIPMLSEMRVPIVLVNNQQPGEFVHSVMIENVQGSREATNHLIQLGHRRIAYLGDRFGHQSDTERFSGYRQALDRAALPFFPEDVSVVGFDDLFIASYTDPPLTTVRQPRRRMGQLAMESLLQLMRGENPSQAITVPAELVIRESSGPVARGRK